MMQILLRNVAWIACVVYSTIPTFWLLIHPRAEFWRAQRRSPYRLLLPLWIAMWVFVAAISAPWRSVLLYEGSWTWIPAVGLFCTGLVLYKLSHSSFTLAQLGGLPEVLPNQSQQQLVTTGIRGHVRHPVYLGHLLRNDGMESFHWPGCLLGAHGTGNCDGRADDPYGGLRTGTAFRRRVSPLSIERACAAAETANESEAIIRLGWKLIAEG